MFKWFRAQSDSVKIMIVIGIVSVIGILFRWDAIRTTLADDFRTRFGGTQGDTTAVESPIPATDTPRP